MRPLTRLEKTGLIAAVVIGSSYFYMARVVTPAEKATVRLGRELATAQETWNGLAEPVDPERFDRAIDRAREHVAEATAERAALTGRKLEDAAIPAAFSALVAAAAEHGLCVQDQGQVDAADLPLLSALPDRPLGQPWRAYRIVLQGAYPGVVRWLQVIADLPHAVIIEALSCEHRDSTLTTTVVIRL